MADNEREVDKYFDKMAKGNALERMGSHAINAIADDKVRGYRHLRGDAEEHIRNNPKMFKPEDRQEHIRSSGDNTDYREFAAFAKGGKVLNRKMWRK